MRTILLSMLGAALWAQTPGAAPAPGTTAPNAAPAADPVVLTAAGETMTRSQFERLLQGLPQNMRQQANSPAGRRELAERFIDLKVLAKAARDRKLDTKPEVAAQLKMQSDSILAQALYQELALSAKPSEAELKAAYDAHKADFEQAKARHILIRFQGSQVPLRKDQKDLTDAEALAKANDLKARIAKGEDFAAIAKAESDDTGSGANGGDLGQMQHGRTVPEFDKAIFALPVNQVSDPVRTNYGYHLIQVQERSFVPFEQVRPELERERAGGAADAAVKALREQSGAKLDEAYFNPAPPPVLPGTPAPGKTPSTPASSRPAPPAQK